MIGAGILCGSYKCDIIPHKAFIMALLTIPTDKAAMGLRASLQVIMWVNCLLSRGETMAGGAARETPRGRHHGQSARRRVRRPGRRGESRAGWLPRRQAVWHRAGVLPSLGLQSLAGQVKAMASRREPPWFAGDVKRRSYSLASF